MRINKYLAERFLMLIFLVQFRSGIEIKSVYRAKVINISYPLKVFFFINLVLFIWFRNSVNFHALQLARTSHKKIDGSFLGGKIIPYRIS